MAVLTMLTREKEKQKEEKRHCEMLINRSPLIKSYIIIFRLAWKTTIRFGYAIWILLLIGLLMPYYLNPSSPLWIAVAAIICSILILIRREKRYERYQATSEHYALLLSGMLPRVTKLLYPMRLIGMVLVCEFGAAFLVAITGAFSIKIGGITVGLSVLPIFSGLIPIREKKKSTTL